MQFEQGLEFGKGIAGVVAPTMVIGLSRAASVRLSRGNITGTIIHGMSGRMEGKSSVITLPIVYVFVTCFDFFVSSGSGKAVVMMPILSPLGQVLGINRQVMVLAISTATASPTLSGPPPPCCSFPCAAWITAAFKFAWKIYACLIAAGFILIAIAEISRRAARQTLPKRGGRIPKTAPKSALGNFILISRKKVFNFRPARNR